MMIRLRNTVRLTVVAVCLMTFAAYSAACPVCYGEQGSAEVEGARWAILFLLGVTGTVLAAVVTFVLHVRKRTKMTLNGPTMPSPN